MALNLEPVYREIFGKLKTRKKFVIQSVENNQLVVEQDGAVAGLGCALEGVAEIGDELVQA